MVARGSDGTGRGRNLPRSGRVVDLGQLERPEILQIGAAVERPEALQAELADARRAQLAAGALELGLDPAGEHIQLGAGNRALMGGAGERAPKLHGLEPLALAASLPHPQALGDDPLVGGEPPPTGVAGAPAADRRATVGRPGLDHPGGGAANRTRHDGDDTRYGQSGPANTVSSVAASGTWQAAGG